MNFAREIIINDADDNNNDADKQQHHPLSLTQRHNSSSTLLPRHSQDPFQASLLCMYRGIAVSMCSDVDGRQAGRMARRWVRPRLSHKMLPGPSSMMPQSRGWLIGMDA